MNKDILAGNWKQFAGKVKQQWGKLTDDEITQINGRSEELAGRLQEKYGYTKQEAENQINQFYNKYNDEKS
jgi:uncharacterized protein YjbJ (UPF0337 family)